MSENRGVRPNNNGEYDLNIKEVFQRAYQLSQINNWTLAQGLLCILVLTIAVYFIFIDAYGITDVSQVIGEQSIVTQSQQAVLEIILTVLLAPLWTGVAMLAIFSKRKEPKPFTFIFSYFRMLPGLALASALISMAFTFGIVLYFIPGFYVFTATTFVLPLMADKKLGPIAALRQSIRKVNQHLMKMLMLYAIFLALLFVVFLSFGFAYIWIGPLYFNVKAILYEDFFTEKVKNEKINESEDIQNDGNEGVFNA